MRRNPLLVLKDQVQQQLDQAAGHDLQVYLTNLHRIVMETEQTYGVKFRYLSPEAASDPGEIQAQAQ